MLRRKSTSKVLGETLFRELATSAGDGLQKNCSVSKEVSLKVGVEPGPVIFIRMAPEKTGWAQDEKFID